MLAVVVALLAAPTADPTLDRLHTVLRAEAEAIRAEADAPGVSVGYALPDGRAGGVAVGLADVAGKVPLTPDHRLLAGSVGKTFVAAVVLQLVEEGVLGLDDTARKWLGKEPWFDRLPNAPALTVRNLLNHRSGLSEYFQAKEFPVAVAADPDRVWSPAELLAFVLDTKPLSEAGTTFAYADTNYLVAGMVAEAASGKRLFAEVERRLLNPLKLDGVVPSDRRLIPRLATGYADQRNPLGYTGPTIRDGRFVINPQLEWAGGGFATTPTDLARWARHHFAGKSLSKPETVAAMLDGQPTGTGRGGGKGARYGLGVQLSDTPLGPCRSHGGWFPGYLTEATYFPAHDLAVVVQINTDVGQPVKRKQREFVARVAAKVCDQLAPAAAADGWQVLFNGKDLAGWKANRLPESFRVEDGLLRVQCADRGTAHLFYVGDKADGYERFTNFELEATARAEPDSNSGIFIHTDFKTMNPNASDHRLALGYEVQLNSSAREKAKTGSLYAIKNLDKSPVDEGKWFVTRVVVNGKRITIGLDGKEVLDYTEPPDVKRTKEREGRKFSPDGGAIALQGHDPKSVWYFKDIRVKRLP